MRNDAKGARRMRPRVEGLEHRALLSDLSMSLTTDKTVYQPGEPIQFTLTETNISDHSVNVVGIGPSIDGFLVTQGGSLVWQSNAGLNPMIIGLETLQPGQSQTFKATWNGVPSQEQSPTIGGGTFSVTNQLTPDLKPTTFQIETPPVTYSFSTDQTEYQVGQPVQITFTETNTSDAPETVNLDPADFTITGFDGGTVWDSGGGSGSPTSETLNPGQSITQSVTWNGISNTGTSPNTTQWGDFNIANPNAPAGLTASFSIDNPLASKLTSQSTSYTPGQPVTLTETITNTSAVPITFPQADGKFDASNLTTSIDSTQTVAATAPTVTLQPGQALTQTATWPNDDLPTLSPGSYYAVFGSSLAEGSAEFTITSPGSNLPPSVPPISVPPPTSVLPISLPPITVAGPGPTDGTTDPPSSAGPLVATLGTSESTYKIGRRASLTLTLTNVSSQSITLPQLANKGTFEIVRGSTVIWRSPKTKVATRARALQAIAAGQSIELKGTWTGKLLHGAAKALKPGVYTLEGSAAGYTASATIQIIGPSAR